MRLLVDRIKSNSHATLSAVYIDGKYLCDGLEDEYRAVKVPGETRIPAGVYRVGVRKVGGFHAKYATRFAAFHRGMLHVLNVPGFEYILIHCGNTERDTAGCLLVGQAVRGQLALAKSALTYERVYRAVIDAAERGDLEIEYRDSDRAG